MKLTFRKDRQELLAVIGGEVTRIPASCIVRNELNGWRKKTEIVHAITKDNIETDIPVMPRTFPDGCWKITSIESRQNRFTKPFLILTNAWQSLERWTLDKNGNYLRRQGGTVKDYQYGLHFSESNTTLGCIRIHNRNDLYWLINKIESEFIQLKAKKKTPEIDLIIC